MFKQILLLSLAGLALSAEKSYDGYKVFTTNPLTTEQARLLQSLQKLENRFDFWLDPAVGMPADIMVGPEDLEELFQILDIQKIEHNLKIADVGEQIKESKVKGPRLETPNPRYTLGWDDYYSHADINQFIDELAVTYSSFVRTRSIGRTIDNRDMRMIEITMAGAGKPNIFIDAGIHAREWIASAVCTYTIRELVERHASHPTWLNSFNFYIVPMANPDGYEFSRSSDRLWRKNRRNNGNCFGVDLNRNWPYHFGESGTSNLQCADTYLGTAAFSEPETQHLRDAYNALSPRPEMAVSMHCYGQYILTPYGYATGQYPANVAEITAMGNAAEVALRAVHGTRFTVMNSALLYPAAGASDDWYKSQGSRYTFTYELRNTNTFILPPAQIIPSGEEMWAAWESMFNTMLGGKDLE